MAFHMKPAPEGSSTVAAYGYDPSSEILRIEFKNGARYDYHGVDDKLAQSFDEAPSKGRFVQQILRPGNPASLVKQDSADGE